jgi:hypothetical protein
MTTACEIPEMQNSERALKHIAAWSFLYGRAKFIAGWQFWLSVPAALAMSLIALRWPEAKLVTTPLSLLFGWTAILWLDRVQNERQKLGAKVQEQFDCELFDLSWNKVRCGAHPETEAVNEAAADYSNKGDLSMHPNWYPPSVGRLPTELARLICQRAAVWWDMSQRREYAAWLIALVGVLVVGVLGLSFTADQRVREMVFTVYVPMAPAIVWSVREWRRQHDAHSGLEKLKGQIESFFAEAIAGLQGERELTQFSRSIQDMIFDGRSRNPLFFNFIYRWLRKKHEPRMNEKAKEMVEGALAQSDKWRLENSQVACRLAPASHSTEISH